MRSDKRIRRPDDWKPRLSRMVSQGISQYEMAAMLGVSRVTVRQMLKECGWKLQPRVYARAGKRAA